jgi:hypothetical protein
LSHFFLASGEDALGRVGFSGGKLASKRVLDWQISPLNRVHDLVETMSLFGITIRR